MFNKLILIVLFLHLVSSCAPVPINGPMTTSYGKAGYLAQQQGDWDTARKNYALAVKNAELEIASFEMESTLNYEYGRSLGVTCFYKDAQTYLLKAIQFDQHYNGPTHMGILELARLNYDQAKHLEATKYFEKLLPIYEIASAEKHDPIGVANVYEEYSISLNKIGRTKESLHFRQLTEELRSNNPGKTSPTERTPYGKQCTNY